MTTRNPAKKKIDKAKNLVRGAMSQLKALSTPERSRDAWRQEQYAQQQVNRALAIARRELSKDQLGQFESWVNDAFIDQLRGNSRLGTPLTSLGILPYDLTARDLETELNLAIERLERQIPELRSFATEATEIAKEIELRNWDRAQFFLEKSISVHGYSHWAVETELALTQAIGGVEAVKNKVNSLSICALGLNKFFLYFFGVRNEPAQTSSRFKINIRKRIEDADLVPTLTAYAKYRLYGELEAQTTSLAQVLASENCSTSIDLFFTTLRVMRVVIGRTAAFSKSTLEATNNGLERMAPLFEAFGIRLGEFQSGRKFESSMLALACSAVDLALTHNAKWPASNDASSFYRRGIASQLSTRDDGVAAEELAKFLLNFSWIPKCLEIRDLTRLPPLPRFFIEENVEHDDVEDLTGSVALAIRSIDSIPVTENTRSTVLSLLAAKTALASGNASDALLKINESLGDSNSGMEPDLRGTLLAHLLYQGDRVQECLDVSAYCGIANDRLISCFL